MSNILFKHELTGAWNEPLNSITILDDKKDNVIIDKKKYTISSEYIKKIKELLNNPILYLESDLLYAPVMDGTCHKILLSNKKKIAANNLWYWDEETFNKCDKSDKKEYDYTKTLIDLINNIQEIIDENNIDFYILDCEEDEDEYEEDDN